MPANLLDVSRASKDASFLHFFFAYAGSDYCTESTISLAWSRPASGHDLPASFRSWNQPYLFGNSNKTRLLSIRAEERLNVHHQYDSLPELQCLFQARHQIVCSP
jgi:hypothetical protein